MVIVAHCSPRPWPLDLLTSLLAKSRSYGVERALRPQVFVDAWSDMKLSGGEQGEKWHWVVDEKKVSGFPRAMWEPMKPVTCWLEGCRAFSSQWPRLSKAVSTNRGVTGAESYTEPVISQDRFMDGDVNTRKGY